MPPRSSDPGLPPLSPQPLCWYLRETGVDLPLTKHRFLVVWSQLGGDPLSIYLRETSCFQRVAASAASRKSLESATFACTAYRLNDMSWPPGRRDAEAGFARVAGQDVGTPLSSPVRAAQPQQATEVSEFFAHLRPEWTSFTSCVPYKSICSAENTEEEPARQSRIRAVPQ